MDGHVQKKIQGVSCSKGNGRLWIASSHSRRRPTKKPLWSCSHIYGYSLQATPRKPTWNPKMDIWKMIFFFKQMIFRFHVSFGECNYHLESGYVWIHGLNVLHVRWIGCFSFSHIPMGRQHWFFKLEVRPHRGYARSLMGVKDNSCIQINVY